MLSRRRLTHDSRGLVACQEPWMSRGGTAMFSSFRLAMTWVHTWFGLVLGYVLVVVFFFGSLSVFDREIDRWAIPATRFEPQPMPSFDTKLRPIFERIEPDPDEIAQARQRVGTLPSALHVMNWSAYTTHRDP